MLAIISGRQAGIIPDSNPSESKKAPPLDSTTRVSRRSLTLDSSHHAPALNPQKFNNIDWSQAGVCTVVFIGSVFAGHLIVQGISRGFSS